VWQQKTNINNQTMLGYLFLANSLLDGLDGTLDGLLDGALDARGLLDWLVDAKVTLQGLTLRHVRVWVELVHGASVLQWVSLEHGALALLALALEHTLDFVSGEQATQVTVGHLWHWQAKVVLGGDFCL